MVKRQRFRRARGVKKLPPVNRPPMNDLPRIAVGRQRHAGHAEEVALHMQRLAKAAGEKRPAKKHRAQPERKAPWHVYQQEAQQQRQPEDDDGLDLGRQEFGRRQQGGERSREHREAKRPD